MGICEDWAFILTLGLCEDWAYKSTLGCEEWAYVYSGVVRMSVCQHWGNVDWVTELSQNWGYVKTGVKVIREKCCDSAVGTEILDKLKSDWSGVM